MTRVVLVVCVTLVLVGVGVDASRQVYAERHLWNGGCVTRTDPLAHPDVPIVCEPDPGSHWPYWAAGTVLVGVAGLMTAGLVLRHGRRRAG